MRVNRDNVADEIRKKAGIPKQERKSPGYFPRRELLQLLSYIEILESAAGRARAESQTHGEDHS